MKIAISVAVESDVAERPVQRLLSRLVRHHEVEVNRRVFARGVNRGAGSAGQDGLDAVGGGAVALIELSLANRLNGGRLLPDPGRFFRGPGVGLPVQHESPQHWDAEQRQEDRGGAQVLGLSREIVSFRSDPVLSLIHI